MNTKSTKFRLTLWYTLAFFFASLVIFSSFYFITRHTLFAQTDAMLSSHGNKVIDIVLRDGQGMHDAIAKQAFLQEFSGIPGMLLVVIDSRGAIVSSSQNITSAQGIFNQLFQEEIVKRQPFYQNQRVAAISMRFLISPIIEDENLIGVVLVAHPIDVIEKSLDNLLVMLAVILSIFLIPTVAGGFLFAKSAMRPIAQISEKIKRITSENLNERVYVPDTKDEVEELAVSFNSLLDRLHESFKRERQFIGNVAHELKTPLATQRSDIEVTLSKERGKDEYKRSLTETLADNNRIATTLKNILDLAWSEEELARGQGEVINLPEMVTELIDLATKMASPKHINITSFIDKNIKVTGNQDKLSRAILNIIDNAIKYTPDKGKINLSLRLKRQDAVLIIKDTGIGISQKDLPHIFERFYRGSKTDKIMGSGLGLAIVQGIIHAHRGSIEVKSKVGHGTTCTILLPLVRGSFLHS